MRHDPTRTSLRTAPHRTTSSQHGTLQIRTGFGDRCVHRPGPLVFLLLPRWSCRSFLSKARSGEWDGEQRKFQSHAGRVPPCHEDGGHTVPGGFSASRRCLRLKRNARFGGCTGYLRGEIHHHHVRNIFVQPISEGDYGDYHR